MVFNDIFNISVWLMINSDKEFEEMLTKENSSSFKLGNYANYDCSAMIDGNKFYGKVQLPKAVKKYR